MKISKISQFLILSSLCIGNTQAASYWAALEAGNLCSETMVSTYKSKPLSHGPSPLAARRVAVVAFTPNERFREPGDREPSLYSVPEAVKQAKPPFVPVPVAAKRMFLDACDLFDKSVPFLPPLVIQDPKPSDVFWASTREVPLPPMGGLVKDQYSKVMSLFVESLRDRGSLRRVRTMDLIRITPSMEKALLEDRIGDVAGMILAQLPGDAQYSLGSAIIDGQYGVAFLLLLAGLEDPRKMPTFIGTLCQQCVEKKDEVIYDLLEFGLMRGVEIKDEDFIFAVKCGDTKVVETLLNYGANPNAKGALKHAIDTVDLAVVSLLRGCGADTDLMDSEMSMTPRQYATQQAEISATKTPANASEAERMAQIMILKHLMDVDILVRKVSIVSRPALPPLQ